MRGGKAQLHSHPAYDRHITSPLKKISGIVPGMGLGLHRLFRFCRNMGFPQGHTPYGAMAGHRIPCPERTNQPRVTPWLAWKSREEFGAVSRLIGHGFLCQLSR